MTSHAEYGLKTPGTEVAKAFKNELKGKNILVTGIGPKGIGGATARAFASQEPALLILASRTQEKIDSVATNIRAAHPNLRVETVLLDLASQKSIRKAAGEIQKLTDKLDILVNNAAAVVYTRSKTAEGIELQFGVNHVGPFLLTNLLMPLLLKSAETGSPGSTRIVSLTSAGHRLSPVRFSDYNLEGKPIPKEEEPFSPMPPMFAKSAEDGYNGTVAYAQSKTANILFTVYLQEHLHKRGIASYVLHPGSIDTELGRDQDEAMAEEFKNVASYWGTEDEGCSTTMVASLDPGLNDIKGLYMTACQFAECAPFSQDSALADKLWHLSEKLVGQEFKLDA